MSESFSKKSPSKTFQRDFHGKLVEFINGLIGYRMSVEESNFLNSLWGTDQLTHL